MIYAKAQCTSPAVGHLNSSPRQAPALVIDPIPGDDLYAMRHWNLLMGLAHRFCAMPTVD
jgi:hypothetical protein